MTIQNRNYPKGSIADSHDMLASSNPLNSYDDSSIKFLADDEILKIFKLNEGQSRTAQEQNYNLYQSETGHWIFPQISYRGCGEACLLMLAYKVLKKQNKEVDFNSYQQRGITTDKYRESKLRTTYGLTVNTFQSQGDNILTLFRDRIAQFGSCIVPIYDDVISGHVVVLTNVNLSKDSVTIIDPFHAWQIEIPSQSLLRRLSKNENCVQIEENAPKHKHCTLL